MIRDEKTWVNNGNSPNENLNIKQEQ